MTYLHGFVCALDKTLHAVLKIKGKGNWYEAGSMVWSKYILVAFSSHIFKHYLT